MWSAHLPLVGGMAFSNMRNREESRPQIQRREHRGVDEAGLHIPFDLIWYSSQGPISGPASYYFDFPLAKATTLETFATMEPNASELNLSLPHKI